MIRSNTNCLVKDMVTEEGAQNLETFKEWSPEEVVRKIANIPPPHPLASSEKNFWIHTSNGGFSVKGAYRMIKENTWNEQYERWKDIQKYQGPQRVRFFLWLVYKQRFLTNLERVRRGISQNGAYPLCQYETEDILHAIRECPIDKEVWSLIALEVCWYQFFSDNLLEWVKINLENHGWMLRHEVPWSTLFNLLTWRIRKSKKFFVFQWLPWSSVEAIKVSISWAKQFSTINS